MYKPIEFEISGVAPLLVHNGHLANPTAPIVRAIKEISSKRNKTDEDLMELARLEFHGGFYLDENGQPIIPGEMIEAMLVEAAKKNRLGKAFKAGIISDGNWPIIYDGPKDVDAMWADGSFAFQKMVVVSRAKILRTRPIFNTWSLKFTVHFLPDVVNESQVRQAMEIAGQIIGLGTWRPRYGRFTVNKAEGTAAA